MFIFFAMTKSYSDTYRLNDTVFISGQIGDDSSGNIPADFEKQLRNAFGNLINRLADESLDLSNIAKLNVYLTNNDQYKILNSVSAEFFNSNKPARTTLIVSELPRNNGEQIILVEIDAVAGK